MSENWELDGSEKEIERIQILLEHADNEKGSWGEFIQMMIEDLWTNEFDDEYTCSVCGNTYQKEQTDEEEVEIGKIK